MSSEVEGLPGAGAGQHAESAAPARRPRHLEFLHRLLRRPFRSVLRQQAIVNRRLTATGQELRSRQDRLESETGHAIGDLRGRLLGELADLQLAMYRMERRLENIGEGANGTPRSESTDRVGNADSARSGARSGRLPDGAGVNLVGDITATTGLAQAGRRLAVGLQRRGVPLTVTSLRSGAPRSTTSFRQNCGAFRAGHRTRLTW